VQLLQILMWIVSFGAAAVMFASLLGLAIWGLRPVWRLVARLAGKLPASEEASLRFTTAGFVLIYIVMMGAIGLASFADSRLMFVFAPGVVVGVALLAIGRFYPLRQN
jgi:hypothetical protein